METMSVEMAVLRAVWLLRSLISAQLWALAKSTVETVHFRVLTQSLEWLGPLMKNATMGIMLMAMVARVGAR